ncbi:glycosyltransferase family 2 protein [Candidatus Woesearchaeota archaeon]|nr:glycosyltransferase family 2 protein [Candidatus Woesearchaeota archaeon]
MKILVGCPTSNHKEYSLKEYLEGVKKLSYENIHFVLVDNSETSNYYEKLKSLGVSVIKDKYKESAKERVINSRNILRRYFLENDYDYFLSLEQDVVPPKDVIEKLLSHNKDIVGGLYFYLGDDNKTLLPMVWIHHEGEYARRLRFSEVPKDELIEVITCGLGCVLIKRDVLENIKFRYEKGKEPWDDLWFCEDARAKGFKVYVDTSAKCKHFVKGMDWSKIKK